MSEIKKSKIKILEKYILNKIFKYINNKNFLYKK